MGVVKLIDYCLEQLWASRQMSGKYGGLPNPPSPPYTIDYPYYYHHVSVWTFVLLEEQMLHIMIKVHSVP